VTTTSEKQDNAEQPQPAAAGKPSSRKSVLAFAIFALGINTSAAIYTMSPSEFSLPDLSHLAELLPQPKASDPAPDPTVVALKDIQSAQQQHAAALHENTLLLKHNTALLQQDSITLDALRQGVFEEQGDLRKISAKIADEHEDVKKISAQISKLMSKVDSLQNSISPEVTSSISAKHANHRSRVVRKKMVRQPQAFGPISVGGAPLSLPATTLVPQS
jgi:hypothetical protein